MVDRMVKLSTKNTATVFIGTPDMSPVARK